MGDRVHLDESELHRNSGSEMPSVRGKGIEKAGSDKADPWSQLQKWSQWIRRVEFSAKCFSRDC